MHSNTKPSTLWLVTGASSGIGHAVALALAQAGQGVIAWGRDAARLGELRQLHAGIVEARSLELARLQDLAPVARDCASRWPALAGVVHCAGLQHELALDDSGYDAAAITAELAVNLAAPIELTRALLAQLQAQPLATVVLVTSALAHAPKCRAATYNASKAGLHAFAQSLRAQLRGGPVRVLELIPPLVDTPMTAGRGSHKIAPDAVAQALLQALQRPRLPEQLWVGRARALPWLLRLAPRTTRQLFLRGAFT